MSDDTHAARLSRVFGLVADLCLSLARDPPEAAIEELLNAHQLEGEDRQAVLRYSRRFGIYRALVRNNLASVVFRLLPRTRRLVNALVDDAFDQTFIAFLASPGPRSAILRDLPAEFFAAAKAVWSLSPERVPRWALELFEYEVALFEADSAADPTPSKAEPSTGTLSLASHIHAVPPARLLHFTHDVLAISDEDDHGASVAPPNENDLWMMISRDSEQAVRTTPLDSDVASVVSSLLGGEPLGSAVQAALEGSPSPETLFARVALALATLADGNAVALAG